MSGQKDKLSNAQKQVFAGSRQSDSFTLVVVPTAGDTEGDGEGEADEDMVASRIEAGRPNVNTRKEFDATNLKIGRDEPAHLRSVWYDLGCREKLILLAPHRTGRVCHGRLFDHETPERRHVLVSEPFIDIPFIHP